MPPHFALWAGREESPRFALGAGRGGVPPQDVGDCLHFALGAGRDTELSVRAPGHPQWPPPPGVRILSLMGLDWPAVAAGGELARRGGNRPNPKRRPRGSR